MNKPHLADPIIETGEIKTNDGQIKMKFLYKMNCNTIYNSTKHTFNFRYEDARFRLIGFDKMKLERISGDATEYSIDYVAGQKKTVTGINVYEKTKRRRQFQKLASNKRFCLDEINLECTPNNQGACSEKVKHAQLSGI